MRPGRVSSSSPIRRRAVAQLGSFDPVALGRLETAAWMAYYRHQWLRFARIALATSKYAFGLPWATTLRCALLCLQAARLWAPVPNNDPARAQRALERFYGIVARHSPTAFDPAVAAALELRWWQVHRLNQRVAPGQHEAELIDALADLYAHVHDAPPRTFRAAAEQRVLAMRYSDQWVRDGCHPASPLIVRERAALVRSHVALLAASQRARTARSPLSSGPAASAPT